MNKGKAFKVSILVLCVIIVNILIAKYCNLVSNNTYINLELESKVEDKYQIFFTEDEVWLEEKSVTYEYKLQDKKANIKFQLPDNVKRIRVDLGTQETSDIRLYDLSVSDLIIKESIDLSQCESKNDILAMKVEEDGTHISTSGVDSFITYYIADIIEHVQEKVNKLNCILKVLICAIFDLIVILGLKKIKAISILISDLWNSRFLIWNLSKNDFKTKYAGSYLGIIWAFVNPVVTLTVYWFVFQFGLRSASPIEGVPFVIWLSAGLVPWFFFQEAVINATNCLIEYSYLVKKVVFKISILPLMKIISAVMVHFVFIVFLLCLSFITGITPSLYMIQLPYYLFCLFIFILSISYITSSIILFFKDIGQIISIALQILMWMTPIMWPYTIVSPNNQWIVKLNPMFYVVEGYRDTFINHVWFYERYFQTVYFWVITLMLFIIGATIFKRLKPHFADVL